MIQIERFQNAKSFLSQVGPTLYPKEAENSLLLGLIEARVGGPSSGGFDPIYLSAVTPEGQVAGVFLQTRQHNAVVSQASSQSIAAFIQYALSNGLNFDGIVGPTESVKQFAAQYAGQKGCSHRVKVEQKILSLEKVIWPQQCSGEMVRAEKSHADLIAHWLYNFHKEALPLDRVSLLEMQDMAQRFLATNGVYLWKNGADLVAMAYACRPTAHSISISGVYTPKENRGCGYASNLVAQLSQKMLDAGKSRCVLYTDAANPTSNRIYQRIGYNIVADSCHIGFVAT